MTGVVGLLVLAAVVVAGIALAYLNLSAMFSRASDRDKYIVTDGLAEIDFRTWEKEFGSAS